MVTLVMLPRRPSYQNPYTPFLNEDEFEFAFRLVKHGISKKAIDDIMSLHTIWSNLPHGHFKSAHTLAKKIDNIEPDGIGNIYIFQYLNHYYIVWEELKLQLQQMAAIQDTC